MKVMMRVGIVRFGFFYLNLMDVGRLRSWDLLVLGLDGERMIMEGIIGSMNMGFYKLLMELGNSYGVVTVSINHPNLLNDYSTNLVQKKLIVRVCSVKRCRKKAIIEHEVPIYPSSPFMLKKKS